MEQTVYVDLFFVINFSMDFLCFFLASQLLGSKLSPWRTVAASALGGIYANMTLFMSVSGIWELALDILVCALMCVVSFGRIKHLFAHVCVYIAISMVLGGFMTALFELLNKIELPLGEIEGDGISAWLLLFLAVVSGALTLFGGKFFRRKSSRKYTAVTVTLSGKSATLPAFCDSGNMLRDPISCKPCILADRDALAGVIPSKVLERAKSGRADGMTELGGDMARRIRLVPAKTATGDGMLWAVRMDSISVGDGKDAKEVDALIAICDVGNSGDGSSAIVPTELL